MTPAGSRRIALLLPGTEQGSHMGATDFRVGGHIFSTLAHVRQGHSNLMLAPETQNEFVTEAPTSSSPSQVAGDAWAPPTSSSKTRPRKVEHVFGTLKLKFSSIKIFRLHPKRWSLSFHYDDTTNVVQLTNNQGIGSTSGADGIVFSPSGTLLVGGQGANRISEITTGGTLLNTTFLRDQSYHLTLSPDGTKVFTSSFGRGFFAAD